MEFTKIIPIVLVISLVLISGCSQQPQKEPAAKRVAGTSKSITVVNNISTEKSDYSIEVSDQKITDSVTISKASTKADGWIVVRAQKDSQPGAILGKSAVKAGDNTNIKITVDSSKATPSLYAVLHSDNGEKGKFEYPGPDTPIVVGETTGEPVQKAFKGFGS